MSEYIPRLREQLVAAAAREQAGQRHRPRVRPRRVAVAFAAAAVLVVAVVAAVSIELPTDETPVAPVPAEAALAYRVMPVPGTDANAAAEASADVLRDRIAAAGIRGATVTVDGDRVGVDVDGAARGQVAALAVPGKLEIYDWEASVLGRDGRPAPADDGTTGGQDAGRGAAVSEYEAVRRAAKADRTAGPPAYWLVDTAQRLVLDGPAWSRDALAGRGDVLEVPGGVRVVRAEGVPAAADRWYALADGAALGNADVADARAGVDPATGEPIVTFDLTTRGQSAFSAVTREIARRGQATAVPGEDPMRAAQHLAIVLDDQIASVPFINYREAPDGIDGKGGAQIQGGLTSQRTRQIATILDSGPMPATLEPVER